MNIFKLFKKKELKEFHREFPVVGTMTCKAEDESRCKDWSRSVDFLWLRDAVLSFGDPVDSDGDIAVMTRQYQLALDNAQAIRQSIESSFRYVTLRSQGIDPDRYVGIPGIVMRTHDDEGNVHPHLAVAYETADDSAVWFSIEEGEMTSYDA